MDSKEDKSEITNDINSTLKDGSVFWALQLIKSVIFALWRLSSVVVAIRLAVDYYKANDVWYCVLAVLCLVVPILVSAVMTLTMYLDDCEFEYRRPLHWTQAFFSVVLFPFVFRDFGSIKYLILRKRAELYQNDVDQKNYLKKLQQTNSDMAFVKIFQCFLESGPQSVLQLYIAIHQSQPVNRAQTMSMVSALVSMAVVHVTYQRCVRPTQPLKNQMSLQGSANQFCWHFCLFVSRITSIAVMMSVTFPWTCVMLGLHVVAAGLVIHFYDNPVFCDQTVYHKLFFRSVLGIVYIFTYVLPREDHTRYRHAVYYTICFLENLVAMILYYILAPGMDANIFWLIAIFFLGIALMMAYYKWLHPNVLALEKQAMET